jgi:hypothetical protein
MRNLNPAYCDSLANKKPKMTSASAHIPCGLQAGMPANPHRICVSGVVLFKKIKNARRLDRHAYCQIAWLIHIRPTCQGRVIRE